MMKIKKIFEEITKPNKIRLMGHKKSGLDIYLCPIEVIYDEGKKDEHLRYYYKIGFFSTANRPFVLVDINGIKIPFYESTGQAGKKNVPSGKWYNIWGITVENEAISMNWLNKGSEKDIVNFYGIELFKKIADKLNKTNLDNLDNKEMGVYFLTENSVNEINKEMKVSPLGKHRLDSNNIERIKRKLINILPEQLKHLVTLKKEKFIPNNRGYDKNDVVYIVTKNSNFKSIYIGANHQLEKGDLQDGVFVLFAENLPKEFKNKGIRVFSINENDVGKGEQMIKAYTKNGKFITKYKVDIKEIKLEKKQQVSHKIAASLRIPLGYSLLERINSTQKKETILFSDFNTDIDFEEIN